MSKALQNKDKILVRLEQDLSKQIRQHAKMETRSINSFIANAVKDYLSRKS